MRQIIEGRLYTLRRVPLPQLRVNGIVGNFFVDAVEAEILIADDGDRDGLVARTAAAVSVAHAEERQPAGDLPPEIIERPRHVPYPLLPDGDGPLLVGRSPLGRMPPAPGAPSHLPPARE